MGIEQFAPRVRQASGILDARPEFVVGAVAIALQNATKALEEGLRAVAPATHLKVHHHRTPRSAEVPDLSRVVSTPNFGALHPHPRFVRLDVPAFDQGPAKHLTDRLHEGT